MAIPGSVLSIESERVNLNSIFERLASRLDIFLQGVKILFTWVKLRSTCRQSSSQMHIFPQASFLLREVG